MSTSLGWGREGMGADPLESFLAGKLLFSTPISQSPRISEFRESHGGHPPGSLL